MTYTLGQAAKATGKSKTTITNAIKKGRISASQRESGGWDIEPSELHRVYPRLSNDASSDSQDIGLVTSGIDPDNKVLQVKVAVQTEKIEQLETRLAEKDDTIGDLRTRLDSADSRIIALLPKATQPRSFWHWLTGKA